MDSAAATDSDVVTLKAMRFHARIGVLPHEAEIARHGSGFVYLISRLGVTGVQETTATSLPATIDRLRSATTLPICVGFGISTPMQARSVSKLADGVVVGSALVRAAASSPDHVLELTRSLREALDG